MQALLVEILRRAFTKENGSLIDFTNEDGSWDWKATISVVMWTVIVGLLGWFFYEIGWL